jgi:acyl transferase domain-containing protein
LSVENGIIPGNPTFLHPNPKINFEHLRVRPSRLSITWPDVPLRRASINSFGYGGSNAHVIIDEANAYLGRTTSSHTSSFAEDDESLFSENNSTTRPYVLVLSANDSASLGSYFEHLDRHLSDPRVNLKLRDVVHTLCQKRSLHFYRAYLVTQTCSLNPSSLIIGETSATPPRLGFVFTGQGAQWSTMGMGLLAHFPVARSMIERLDKVLKQLSNGPTWSLFSKH